jgi:hypothetical protein
MFTRMINQKYFEDVLPDQVRAMERPVRLTVHVTSGEEYLVHSLVPYTTCVVLQVYGKKEAPKHTKTWRDANPNQDTAIFDQVCLPYSSIVAAHLTARATKGDDAQALIGLPRT